MFLPFTPVPSLFGCLPVIFHSFYLSFSRSILEPFHRLVRHQLTVPCILIAPLILWLGEVVHQWLRSQDNDWEAYRFKTFVH